MSNFLYFFFRNIFPRINGFFIKTILKYKGIKVGKNFQADKFPKLLLDSKNIEIQDNVIFFGNVEIRLSKNGFLKICNNCKIDDGVRILVANDAKLIIDEQCAVGKGTVINAGADVLIKKKCLISGYVYIQSSSHKTNLGFFIKDQEYFHQKIVIEDDVWIGAHSTIMKGVVLKKGSIVGANSIVNKNTEENSINAGNPSKIISYRKYI